MPKIQEMQLYSPGSGKQGPFSMAMSINPPAEHVPRTFEPYYTSPTTPNPSLANPLTDPISYYGSFLEKKLTVHLQGKNLIFFCRKGLEIGDHCEYLAKYFYKTYKKTLETEAFFYQTPDGMQQLTVQLDNPEHLMYLFDCDYNVHIYQVYTKHS